MWDQLLVVIRKEIQQTLRDRRMMVLLSIAPLLQTFVFGFAVNFETDHIPTAIIDLDNSVESRGLVQRLFADGTLVPSLHGSTSLHIETKLDHDEVDVAVVIPEDFQRDQFRGRRPTVQALVDGSDPNRSAAAQGFLSAQFSGRASFVTHKYLFNPSLDTAPYMLPGVAGVLLLLVTTIVSSMGLARERETGTLEQLRVTPIPAAILLLGKIFPFAAMGFVVFGLAMTIASVGFGTPLRGSLIELAAIGIMYLGGTLSTGLAVSTFSRNQQQAFLAGFLVLLPFALLSGIFTPVDSMPPWLQAFTWINPLRHFAVLVRANVFWGGSLAEALPHVGCLLGYATLMGSLAVIRFSRLSS